MKPLVTILTYCAHPALAYGTLLVFKTLRTGFPTADVEVFDNGSHPDVRDQVMAECARVGASFVGIKPQSWVDHYKWLVLERQHEAGRPLVIVDPDVIFWENCEEWDFTGSLLAGRRMRRINAGPIVQHARLHPSHLWIPDVDALRQAMGTRGCELIAPALGAFDGETHFWDTFARLYEEMVHWCHGFSDEKLDCFDHLFYGSHLPAIAAQAKESLGIIGYGHIFAATDNLEELRGIWRFQDAYFEGDDKFTPHRKFNSSTGGVVERMLYAAFHLGVLQDKRYGIDELEAAMEVLARRVQRKEEIR
jgi:hypothetical protein